MDHKIAQAFAELKMSDECTEKIEKTMAQHRVVHRCTLRAVTSLAACVALAVLVLSNAQVVQALEELMEEVNATVTSLFIPGATVEEYYEFEGGNLIIEQGKTAEGKPYGAGEYKTGSIPSWLLEENGRLYFTGNGEHTDVTDLISEETPFTYVFTDADRIRHYIAIGGVYGTGETALDKVGWSEWMQKAPYDMTSWLGGYTTGQYDAKTDSDRAWLEKAKDIMDIPWS